MLPSNYSTILANGIHALQSVEAELRTQAQREPDAGELWLTVRDISTLLGRLTAYDDWEWQTGVPRVLLSPLDLSALAALLEGDNEISPYRDQNVNTAIQPLHRFLERYMAGEVKFEDAMTYPMNHPPPAS